LRDEYQFSILLSVDVKTESMTDFDNVKRVHKIRSVNNSLFVVPVLLFTDSHTENLGFMVEIFKSLYLKQCVD